MKTGEFFQSCFGFVSLTVLSFWGGWNREVNLPSPYFLSQFSLLPTFWANFSLLPKIQLLFLSLLPTFSPYFSLLPTLFGPFLPPPYSELNKAKEMGPSFLLLFFLCSNIQSFEFIYSVFVERNIFKNIAVYTSFCSFYPFIFYFGTDFKGLTRHAVFFNIVFPLFNANTFPAIGIQISRRNIGLKTWWSKQNW